MEEATKKVEEDLKDRFQDIDDEIIISDIIHFERGWVFDYNTKSFIGDSTFPTSLIGHKPYIVDKIDGTIKFLYYSSHPFATYEEWIELYIKDKKQK